MLAGKYAEIYDNYYVPLEQEAYDAVHDANKVLETLGKPLLTSKDIEDFVYKEVKVYLKIFLDSLEHKRIIEMNRRKEKK